MKKSILTALLVLSPAAWSADVFVGGHAGVLLGYGVEVGVDFDQLTLRGQFSRFDYDDTETEDNVSYETDISLDNRGVLLDIHPFGNNFFLSAGIYDNGNSVDILGTPVADDVLVGDAEFTKQEVGSLLADTDFGGTSPYAGLGWNFGRSDAGFALSLEAGALFNGEADVSLISVDGLQPGDAGYDDFQEALRREEQDLQDDLDELEIIPVLKLGLRYYF